MCSYLKPRNGGVYYTRMVVPPRLRAIIGKSDLGRSLGTKDRAEAKRLLPAWLAGAQSIIAAAEAELSVGQTPTAAVAANDDQQSITSVAMDLGMIHESQPDHAFPEEPDALAIARSELREAMENKVLLEQIRADRRGKAYSGKPLDTDIVDLWAAERKPKQKGIDTHRAVARWFYDRIGEKPVDLITRRPTQRMGFQSRTRRRQRISEGRLILRLSTRSLTALFTPHASARRRVGERPPTGYPCSRCSPGREWRSLASFVPTMLPDYPTRTRTVQSNRVGSFI